MEAYNERTFRHGRQSINDISQIHKEILVPQWLICGVLIIIRYSSVPICIKDSLQSKQGLWIKHLVSVKSRGLLRLLWVNSLINVSLEKWAALSRLFHKVVSREEWNSFTLSGSLKPEHFEGLLYWMILVIFAFSFSLFATFRSPHSLELSIRVFSETLLPSLSVGIYRSVMLENFKHCSNILEPYRIFHSRM